MNILAINPWAVDCAAYDFWLKPYGFLVILSYLKNKGLEIDYIDCLDKKITTDEFGRGKIYSERIKKPQPLLKIPRYFKRYGIRRDAFRDQLKNKNPDYILITSSMTYWYPAIIDVVSEVKRAFPNVPLVLGGTYADLSSEHAAENTHCDFIFKSSDLKKFFKLLKVAFDREALYSTLPAYDCFYANFSYVVLRTSWGCPFSCSYCAIKELFSGFFRVPLGNLLPFIIKYSKKAKDFVLYDDAFLYEGDEAKKFLRGLNALNIPLRFHTPNALHLKFLDEETACLLKKTGFINPHFGLETLNPRLQKLWGDKVNEEDLIKGVETLKRGGFRSGEFSVYLLLGYPEQDLAQLKREAEFLHCLGAKISFSEFSPVPKTELFKKYGAALTEPLLHNNSLFSFFTLSGNRGQEKIKDFWEIKNYVRELNKKLP